jgi:hypothetical protein
LISGTSGEKSWMFRATDIIDAAMELRGVRDADVMNLQIVCKNSELFS